ncbi:hypothetical protein [Natronococcus occultus]|uniref:Uncharacterized protein n=1 Tax=Natronococcus occultus SP4 TaxID=694430 RepID=L0K125_9EURY|nr:hypothetical protein [Natronococcus occultus]AGB37803.1 hypothetical protein Natoc_2017 [Natronococcus occultus SP4]
MRTVLAAVLFVVLVGVGLSLHRRRSRRRRSPLLEDVDDQLAESMGPGTGSHLERAPRVRRLDVLEGHNGDPVYAPRIRIVLGTTDAPGMGLVFEYVASALEAAHPRFRERDGRVESYDVEFTFGPDGLLVEGACRRVTVPAALADELLANDRYRAFDLRRDVERADGDEDSVAALWEPCRS